MIGTPRLEKPQPTLSLVSRLTSHLHWRSQDLTLKIFSKKPCPRSTTSMALHPRVMVRVISGCAPCSLSLWPQPRCLPAKFGFSSGMPSTLLPSLFAVVQTHTIFVPELHPHDFHADPRCCFQLCIFFNPVGRRSQALAPSQARTGRRTGRSRASTARKS